MNKLIPKLESEIFDSTPTDSLTIRSKIEYLEQHLKTLPQIDMPPIHHFADGIYARELFIPAGTLLTGKIHKTEHINIVSKGSITVLTEDGVKRIEAPFIMIARPGTKRVGYAHEDTVWTTIHATKETDLIKLEAELIAETHSDVLLTESDIKKLQEIKCLG